MFQGFFTSIAVLPCERTRDTDKDLQIKISWKSFSRIFGIFVTLFEFCWMTRALRFVFLCLAGVMIFHDFLKSQYSEENLLFWLAVEKLKKETDQVAVKELAQSIYRDYLSAESPKEVSNNMYIIFVRELLSNSERIFFGVRENGLASNHINSSPPKKGKSK